MFRSLKSRAAVAAVSVLMVAVPVVGLASPAGAASGCGQAPFSVTGPVSAIVPGIDSWDAGDQVTLTAADNAANASFVHLEFTVDNIVLAELWAPGSVTYTFPSATGPLFWYASIQVSEGIGSISCAPAPPPPPPYTGGPLGSCDSTLTAPTNLSTAPGDGSATVSWAPATSAPEGCIAGYVVTPYIGTTAQTPVSITGQGTTTVVKGLTNGTAYTFKVAAQNGISTGPSSDATTPITIGAPAATTNVRAARVGRGAVKVAFNPPENNGSPITRYVAACKSTNGGATRAKAGTKSPIVVTGLTAGKTYRCNVTATNGRGNGPASRASSTARA